MEPNEAGRSGVEHIVALVLENRSFDHILGDLGRRGVIPVDAAPPNSTNPDLNGQHIGISAASWELRPDLPHDLASVLTSLSSDNGGFVLADQLYHKGGAADPRRVMSAFESGALPVTHALARGYSTCDAWFSSVPAGTWPNRLFMIAGTSDGQVTNIVPPLLYTVPTVFGRLASSDWAVYNDQIPNVTVVRKLAIEWAFTRHRGPHFRSLARFDDDCRSGRLPYFSLVEPVYLGREQDDAHPPTDIRRSEALLARVFLALRRSPLWERTLLLVLYDEHGGFFDHVKPPSGVPSPGAGPSGFEFTSLGVRIPCLIVSPFAPPGCVWRPPSGTFADHTSLVATVLRGRRLEPLTPRDAAAADVWSALTEAAPRDDDAATVAEVAAWLETRPAPQEVRRRRYRGGAPSDPLDPSFLEEKSGREVAAIIASTRPRPGRKFRGGQAPVNATDAVAASDVSLEEALVDLSHVIATLPDGPADGAEPLT